VSIRRAEKVVMLEEIYKDCNKLVEYIKQKLRENPALTIDLLASELGKHRTSIFRRLKECNTTFEDLKNK
jgi:hypothetical protein